MFGFSKKRMFLQPKRTKYKKHQKSTKGTFEFKAIHLTRGTIGLKATESGFITARQLEAARRVISRKIARKGKLWLRVFPSIPITRKPTEVRMGKGKGVVNHWVVKVKKGNILFELCGIPYKIALLALGAGGNKLPIKTAVIT